MTNQFDKIYVLDTNIILQDAMSLVSLSDKSKNLIVLPETVLDEIDSKKSGFDEINYQAREFGRILSDAVVNSVEDVHNNHKIIKIKLNDSFGTRIDIISKDVYKTDSKNIALNIYNDRKILEICQFASNYYANVAHCLSFVSLDIMARTRALSLGLDTQTLVGDNNKEFDISDFHKTIELDMDFAVECLNGSQIEYIDDEYKPYNFSYTFISPNGREILAVIQNGKIQTINEDDVRKQIVTPKNKEQILFSHSIINGYYDIIVTDAKAGSGKTLLALSGAMKLVRKREYSKIVYIRNSIESLDKGEDVGYLAGNEEKFAIYNHPLNDSLEYIVRLEHKKNGSKDAGMNMSNSRLNEAVIFEKIAMLKEKYNISTMWTGEARGRTISDSVVIIDEVQNMSNKTLQLVLTRIDNSCKVIILGSNKQIDNYYINKYTNGLTTILNSTKEFHQEVNLFAICLQKVLRGPITEWAEKIFSIENRG
jgi:PhoH-like ATPase